MGKSSLVDYAMDLSKHLNVYYLIGSGDSIENNTPFYCWHTVLQQLFGFEKTDPNSNHNLLIFSQLEEEVTNNDPSMKEFLPLLKYFITKTLPIANSETHENEDKKEKEKERLENIFHVNTRKIFKYLLQKRALSQPIILIIEDIHWVDESSLLLLREVAEETKNILLLMTSRVYSNKNKEGDYFKLKNLEHLTKLVLRPLEKDECATLCKNLLGCNSINPSIPEAIFSRVQGNPMVKKKKNQYQF